MIGMMHRDEADVGITDFTFRANRIGGADYLVGIDWARVGVFVKRRTGNKGLETFVKPFKPELFVVTFISYTISAIAMAFIYFVTKNQNGLTESKFDFSNSFFVAIHGLMLQGCPTEPAMLSTRIIFLAMFLSGIVLYVAYSACLTSFLAVKRFHLPFIDMHTLYHDSDYWIMSVKGSPTLQRLKVRN